MKNLKRTSIAASLVAAWLFSGCDGASPLFKTTNLDPHVPVITNLQSDPAEIFTGEKVRGTFTYFDEGADIEVVRMRDLNSSDSLVPTPPIQLTPEGDELPAGVFFFPGTNGVIEWELVIETQQAGLHTIKVWLEDSKESRSDPVFFTVQVNY